MPATAVTRPPPTDGPRLRNLRLLSESAPWGAAAVASGFADWGRAPPRRRPWAAAGTTTQTASIRLKKATGRRERRSIAASCSRHAATDKGERALSYTGTKRPLDRVALVTLPVLRVGAGARWNGTRVMRRGHTRPAIQGSCPGLRSCHRRGQSRRSWDLKEVACPT